MTQTLPLFPLGTVLYPGLLLPLHIFEERYRQLVRDLLERPEPRRFGVIAIREGRETGGDGVSALHEVGCTATVRRVLNATTAASTWSPSARSGSGSRRSTIPRPYLLGEVESCPRTRATRLRRRWRSRPRRGHSAPTSTRSPRGE